MLVQHHAREEWDLLRWVVLLALAGALSMVFVTRTAGATELRPPMPEPELLAADIATVASPMEVDAPSEFVETTDVSVQVWQAIDAQYHNEFDEAIELWNKVELPCDTEVWRHVALGQAYLATGDIDAAKAELNQADELGATNAVVRYALAVLRLQQAHVAEEWHDMDRPAATVFVTHAPHEVVPNTTSLYRLQAMMLLKESIDLAPQVHLHESLVPEDWPTQAACPPTVHDVLLATRMNNFPAKAHNMLGVLYLNQGVLDQAEYHMDEAVAGGLSVAYGYSDLAEAYEDAGQHSDAMRAYMKASQEEPGKIAPLRKAWENMWKSM